MPGERTEKATPKRRQKAREEGQVAKSKDLTSAVTLFAGVLFLNAMMGMVFVNLKDMLKTSLTFQQGFNVNQENIIPLLTEYFLKNLKFAGPFLLITAIIGSVISFIQVGAFFNFKMLQPKLSHVNPLKGLKNMFSMRTLIELVKMLLITIVVALIAYADVRSSWNLLLNMSNLDLEEATFLIGGLIFRLGLTISLFLLCIGVADFFYQRYAFEKSIKMSKEEIKQEYKDVEGDPQIVARRRERMRQLAMNRMIQAVPKADVIITNPTHIAIAIQYDLQTMEAPVVLAMGEDRVAERIREVAKEHGIEIVENKPLARALYETAEINRPIPVDFYQAVAEVLAFVYRLQKRKI